MTQVLFSLLPVSVVVTFQDPNLNVGMKIAQWNGSSWSIIGSVVPMAPLFSGSQSYGAVFNPNGISAYIVEMAVYTDSSLTTYDQNYFPASKSFTTDRTIFPMETSLLNMVGDVGLKKFIYTAGVWSQQGSTVAAQAIDGQSSTYGAIISLDPTKQYAIEMAVYTDNTLTAYDPNFLPNTNSVVFDPLDFRDTVTNIDQIIAKIMSLQTPFIGMDFNSSTISMEFEPQKEIK